MHRDLGVLRFFICCNSPQWARASSFTTFLDHTQRRTTVGRTPLDKWSARCRDIYLTTHNTHNRHPFPRWHSNPQSKERSAFEPAATATGSFYFTTLNNFFSLNQQSEYKVLYVLMCWLSGSLTCRLPNVMRSPPARRFLVSSIIADWFLASRRWGFYLKSNSTNYPDHGHHGDLPPQWKSPW